jgi:Clathrin adaptor complex small chain
MVSAPRSLTTAILILDSDGNRILAKYYQPPHLGAPLPPQKYITTPQPNPYPTLKDQKHFEKGLFEKTKKQSSDVILYDNKLVVYKQAIDATLYVIGGVEENEIMLYLVVVALRDCLDVLLKYVLVKGTDIVILSIVGQYWRIMIWLRCVLMRFVMMGLFWRLMLGIFVLGLRNLLRQISRMLKLIFQSRVCFNFFVLMIGLVNAYKSVRELARERNWL